jgi:hypothetical protein
VPGGAADIVARAVGAPLASPSITTDPVRLGGVPTGGHSGHARALTAYPVRRQTVSIRLGTSRNSAFFQPGIGIVPDSSAVLFIGGVARMGRDPILIQNRAVALL